MVDPDDILVKESSVHHEDFKNDLLLTILHLHPPMKDV
jgi:hypothetical protein